MRRCAIATVGNLIVNLKAQTADFSAGINRAKAAVKDLDDTQDRSRNRRPPKLFDFAREANLEARQSGEAAFERLLRGAGALGLVTFAVEGATKAVDALGEAFRKVADGEETAARGALEVVDATLKGIPIIEKFYQLGQSIGNAIVGRDPEANKKAVELAGDLRKGQYEIQLAQASRFNRERLRISAEHEEKQRELGLKAQTIIGENVGSEIALNQKLQARLKGIHLESENEERRYRAELLNIQNEEGEKRWQSLRTFENSILDFQTRNESARLRSLGQQGEAEILQLKADHDKQHNEILDYYDKEFQEAKDDDARYHQLHVERAERLAALDKFTGDQTIRIRRDFARRLTREIEDEQTQEDERLAAVTSRAQSAALTASGQQGAASLAQLRAQHDAELAEISKFVRERQRKFEDRPTVGGAVELAKSLFNAIRQRAAVEQQFDSETAENKKRLANEATDLADRITHISAEAKISELRKEGEAGDQLKKREAERLEIQEQYNQRHREYLRILREEQNLTDEQRGKILEADNENEKERQAALRALDRKGFGSTGNSAVVRQFSFDLPGTPNRRSTVEETSRRTAVATEKESRYLTGTFQQQILGIYNSLTGKTTNTSTNFNVVQF